MKEQVLQAMREAGKPVSAGDVTKACFCSRCHVLRSGGGTHP